MQPKSLSWDADTAVPLDLHIIKSQLRIDHDEFDPVIMGLHLPGAVEWAEGEMHRSILSKTHYWVLSDFPRSADQSIRLPRGKTQSVASIAYVSNNATTTLTGPSSGSPQGTGYREDLRGNGGGKLYPAVNSSWPSVDVDAPTPVLITFSAGWTQAQIPSDIRQALAMYISDGLEITGTSELIGRLVSKTHVNFKGIGLTGWRINRWY